ncbi:hypothetical protein C8Q73DRAFT_530200 [Cubamyces lactineus]|nr:hypothetical protein C8Q73DRAFT_530200 [Cubamyces lactineus]
MERLPALPTSEAVTSLKQVQDEINSLVLRLDDSVRRALNPLGFGFRPTEWTREVRKVFRELNREYRYEARQDIIRNARKISRRGVKFLLERIVEGKHMVDTVTTLLAEFQDLRRAYSVQSYNCDKASLVDYVDKFERAFELINEGVSKSANRFLEWKDYFFALDKPLVEVKTMIDALYQTAPQRDNATAAKAPLAYLAELHEQRLELSAKATSAATRTYHIFQSHGDSLPQAVVDSHMSDLRSIYDDLLAHQRPLSDTLQAFEVRNRSRLKPSVIDPPALIRLIRTWLRQVLGSCTAGRRWTP